MKLRNCSFFNYNLRLIYECYSLLLRRIGYRRKLSLLYCYRRGLIKYKYIYIRNNETGTHRIPGFQCGMGINITNREGRAETRFNIHFSPELRSPTRTF